MPHWSRGNSNNLLAVVQRPDLVAPAITIYENRRDLVTPGYFFLAPYQQVQETPHIYDNDGVSCNRLVPMIVQLTSTHRTSYGPVLARQVLAYRMRHRSVIIRENRIFASIKVRSWSDGAMVTESSWTSTIAL